MESDKNVLGDPFELFSLDYYFQLWAPVFSVIKKTFRIFSWTFVFTTSNGIKSLDIRLIFTIDLNFKIN